MAARIDLNTLDALSSSCRQIRTNLIQYRTYLIGSTLHCENEEITPDPEHTFRYRARAADWYFVEGGREALGPGAGKFGDCARDMVGECRRCSRIVCRVSISYRHINIIANHHDRTAQSNLQHPFSSVTAIVESAMHAPEYRSLYLLEQAPHPRIP